MVKPYRMKWEFKEREIELLAQILELESQLEKAKKRETYIGTSLNNTSNEQQHNKNIQENISTGGFVTLKNNWLYYLNKNDGCKIYKMSTDGKQRQKLNDDNSHSIIATDEWVYYLNHSDDLKIYKIYTDGTRRQKLNNVSCDSIYIVDEWIYYTSNYGKIYRMRTDGALQQKLNDDNYCFLINVSSEWVYYINGSDGDKIYKVRIDGTQKQKLSEDASYINLAGAVGESVDYIGNVINEIKDIYKNRKK